MERVLSQEDRIRRAEELVELRRNNRGIYRRESTLGKRFEEVPITPKKTLVKKLTIQVVLCLIVYTLFFTIKNQNYVFSEDFINKTKEVLSTDINFIELYNTGLTFFQEKYNSEYKEKNKKDQEIDENKNENNSVSENEELKKEIKEKEDENVEIEELSQMDKDAKYIKENYSIIKPVEGIVSSEFGDRYDSNPIVTEVHKGIDISANKGTKIVAAMDGVVDIATTSSSYGEYIQITNDDVKTIYAHCDKLYVKEGEKVKKGQDIAEVGQTGAATRTAFAF